MVQRWRFEILESGSSASAIGTSLGMAKVRLDSDRLWMTGTIGLHTVLSPALNWRMRRKYAGWRCSGSLNLALGSTRLSTIESESIRAV